MTSDLITVNIFGSSAGSRQATFTSPGNIVLRELTMQLTDAALASGGYAWIDNQGLSNVQLNSLGVVLGNIIAVTTHPNRKILSGEQLYVGCVGTSPSWVFTLIFEPFYG